MRTSTGEWFGVGDRRPSRRADHVELAETSRAGDRAGPGGPDLSRLGRMLDDGLADGVAFLSTRRPGRPPDVRRRSSPPAGIADGAMDGIRPRRDGRATDPPSVYVAGDPSVPAYEEPGVAPATRCPPAAAGAQRPPMVRSDLEPSRCAPGGAGVDAACRRHAWYRRVGGGSTRLGVWVAPRRSISIQLARALAVA